MPTLDQIRDQLRRFVSERDWAQFHDPKNLSMAVDSEAGELLAEYRWIENAKADAYSAEPEARARIADEAADVGISLLLLCDRIGIDLLGAIEVKLEKNRQKYPVERSRGRADRP
jgi:NTP pyrophosphatase (non-canonical NTP hydrolase)